MEIKIDLDMSKIDYDAINKQIQEKIAEMDLAASYNFKYTIESRIDGEVADCVSEFFRTRRWGELNSSSKEDMNRMLYNKAQTLIEPHVTNIISQIPEEEMNKIIMDLIPKILVDLISNSLRDTLVGYWQTSSAAIIEDAAQRVRSCMY